MENNEKELNMITVKDVSLFTNATDCSDNIASENATAFYQNISLIMLGKTINIKNMDLKKFRDTVAEILCTLSPRERDVLRLRLGMDDGRFRTYEEIGQLFGVKKYEIRLVESKVLRKLRHPNRINYLRKFLETDVTKSEI